MRGRADRLALLRARGALAGGWWCGGDYRQTVVVIWRGANSRWGGTLTAGDLTRPLEHVSFAGESIHFDTHDQLAFDGRIEGESMV